MSLPVVFIHGLFGSERDWNSVLMGLRHFDNRALTLPGHGGLGVKLQKYAVDDFATWVAEQIKIPSHFVGYSLGGRILLSLFEKRPELFLSLSLISTSPGINEERLRQSRLSHDGHWCDAIRRGTPQEFFSKWYGQELFASLKNKPYLLPSLVNGREADWDPVFEIILRETSPGKNKSMWGQIKNIPDALWVVGNDDPKYVAMGQSVIAENPKIGLKCVENAGHAIHLENPAVLIKILDERLRKYL